MRRVACLLGAAGIAVAVPSLAPAQIDTGGVAAGGSYRLRVMSWRDIPFRSVVRQRYDFSCGSAAVATLLSYHYGRPTPEDRVFAAMWRTGDQATIRRSGFSMLDIKRYLASLGYRTVGYRLSETQLGRLRQPGLVILTLNGFRHFVVVKGADARGIVVGDPTTGLHVYSPAAFGAVWNGIFLTIVSAAQGDRPGFDLDRDRLPWSRAPLRSASGRGDIARLTDNLPPLYQITSRASVAAAEAIP